MASKPLKPLYWTDAHFCGLRAQTNVYGLTKITSKEGLTKLLAASINGHFVSVEYQKSSNRLIPITREDVFFSSGPHSGPAGGTEVFEIVSVDVICNSDGKERIILAITYLLLASHFEQKSPSPHMNIYFLPEKEPDGPYLNIIDAVPLSQVQSLNLDFIPFKLMHFPIYKDDGSKEMCFLLGGGDHKVHVYRQSAESESFYEEQEAVDKFFPEFAKIDGGVTQMELMQVNDEERLTALGLQTGLVSLTHVNIKTKEILKRWTTELDSPITSLQLFTLSTRAPCPEFLDKQDLAIPDEKEEEPEAINLLVTSAIDPSVVFWDVVCCGLSQVHHLPYSNSQDVVLCSCVIDIDFDGENEILIGTYGQVLLAYKFVQYQPHSMLMTSTPFQSPMPIGIKHTPTPPSDSEKPVRGDSSFDQCDNRRRHKSMATALDSSDGMSKLDRHDRHKSDEVSALLDASLVKDHQMARLVRSQENLASPRSVYFATPDHLVSSELSLPSGNLPELTEYPCYRLKWTKRFSDPVMGLTCDDVMGDGMLDLVVLTLKGLHIMQPDLNEVSQLVLERLRLVVDPGSEADDDYHRLQTETLDQAN
ncbi:KICSTOR complex protein kaptin [Aplysia californica]|uniref:KICSTOR complex protein kaptin n=1 Tax=Aplysia californica TaxID=6500 RepID=A0ABM0K6H0_APLCA|nr:KICSTOR complex protein kaptin [Aplysia californica]